MSRTWLPAVFIAIACGTLVHADTLVMKNGSRLEGRVVSVRYGVIEFEQTRGLPRIVQIKQSEVRSIEYETRAHDVTVSPRARWMYAGVTATAGRPLSFAVSGSVEWLKGRRSGPNGASDGRQDPNRTMPDRPVAALVGRIGNSGTPFFIGDGQTPIRPSSSGPLFLGVNDDHFEDNSGYFSVTVRY